MDSNKKKNTNDGVFSFLLFLGGLWWLRRFLKNQSKGRISGLSNAHRNLYPYITADGRELFLKELKAFDQSDLLKIIHGIKKARLLETLEMPFFKTLKGTSITAELRPMPFRIFVYTFFFTYC